MACEDEAVVTSIELNTDRNLDPLSEYSTIDTSECVLGALFAGNYFGGEVLLINFKVIKLV